TWTWASWRYTDEQAPDRRSVAVVRADLPRGGAVVDVRLGGSDPVAAPGLARRRCADRAGVARPARGPAHGSAAPPATARRPGLALLPHMLAGGAFEGPAGRLPSAACSCRGVHPVSGFPAARRPAPSCPRAARAVAVAATAQPSRAADEIERQVALCGAGSDLVLRNVPPVRVHRLRYTPGDHTMAERFQPAHRPSSVRLTRAMHIDSNGLAAAGIA